MRHSLKNFGGLHENAHRLCKRVGNGFRFPPLLNYRFHISVLLGVYFGIPPIGGPVNSTRRICLHEAKNRLRQCNRSAKKIVGKIFFRYRSNCQMRLEENKFENDLIRENLPVGNRIISTGSTRPSSFFPRPFLYKGKIFPH